MLTVGLLALAWVTDTAELGVLGLFYASVSALPLVHGLTTPGVLYGNNSATGFAQIAAVPLGLILAGPLILPRRVQRVAGLIVWKCWVSAGISVVVLVSAALLIWPNTFVAPTPRSPVAVTVIVTSLVGLIILALRHLRLARIAQSPLPLAMSAGYGLVGSSVAMWVLAKPSAAGWWLRHLFDLPGVSVATVAAIIILGRASSVRETASAALVIDPLAALELGLDPVVHH